ncbi:hypothetical protein [Moraxella bovis]|uniref:Uncharacterized protein n=1 Tax=Moraxella bovis TaxID=476 RepID=A0ABY6M872_MORBO|nr:hypothetical protein [Moraxella bovis]UZA02922.1 hypothetical protein LP092_13455 [Moraxella bovis]UZA54016.1 hypothetical protein LP111_12675 [Moraxella bovis]UZA57378.1 hypothetical protein LP127_01500 [Moraxella bovis]
MSDLTTEYLYALSDEELMNKELSDEPMQEEVQTDEIEPEAVTEETAVDDTKTSDEVEEETAQSEESDETAKIDYKAFYESMTKPFKANGREVQISNVDDAIRLMQQGANYSKKMEELKPKRALIKTLEQHGLTDKEQLGYLVDLANKDPKAIAKLVKESGIDLYEFDVEQANEYSPNLQVEEPTAFEDIVSEITANDVSAVELLNTIGQWDNETKDFLYEKPEGLRIFAEHKANGFFDKVVGIIENERMFGRMTDKTYLEAYAEIEAKLNAQNQQQNRPQSFTGTRPKDNNTALSNTDKKKRASMPNSGNTTQTTTFNPLTATDEELIQYLAVQS